MDKNKIEKMDLKKTDWKSSREFFQSLEDELRDLDGKDEKYDFTWVGKRKAIIEAGSPINKTLRPDVESSKNWETTENLYIEGDNLDALKLLQESYLGKVKMIYIDPPYNTGKDFVYHDNFKASIEDYDEATEYKDEEGNIHFKKNEKSNGRYHSDWLSMMYPRLKLARNLLKEDGVIFISIDDNEVHNLRKLCDDVFGEATFLGLFTWQKKTQPSFLSREISIVTEYIISFKKRGNPLELKGGIIDMDRTSELINIGNPIVERVLNKNFVLIENGEFEGTLKAGEYGNGVLKIALLNDINVIMGIPEDDIKIKGRITMSQTTIDSELLKGGKIYIKSTKTLRPTIKRFRTELGIKPPISLLSKVLNKVIPTNTDASNEIKSMFEGINIMDYPKPVNLLKYLLDVVMFNSKDSIVLDFFSGSATTAHAVMQLNAEDGGNRKFIMVQIPELTDKISEAYKAGYKNICEIGRERIRRAGDKIAKENPEAKVDYGFRSLVIADTNYKDVNKTVDKTGQAQLQETIDNIKDDRTPLDLLFGVLTQLALELNRPIETREFDGNPVYLYDYLGEVSGLAACFSESISEETIKSIAKLKPLVAVFKDSSFPDSQAKINLSEHFKVLSPDTKIKVI